MRHMQRVGHHLQGHLQVEIHAIHESVLRLCQLRGHL